MAPPTTVILPTIRQTDVLEQVAAQLGPDDELLVFCDAETDPVALEVDFQRVCGSLLRFLQGLFGEGQRDHNSDGGHHCYNCLAYIRIIAKITGFMTVLINS